MKALLASVKRYGQRAYSKLTFPGSTEYWQERYAMGGNSGVGSLGDLAKYKAELINAFVFEKRICSVIEFGCGDGNQLALSKYPQYLGFDVSAVALQKCKMAFYKDATKTFDLLQNYHGQKADLSLSLDVIYHLVENVVFARYMKTLFEASEKYVIIYSSNTDDNNNPDPHVRHRRFSRYVETQLRTWNLVQHIHNKYPFYGDNRTGSMSDFFIYRRDTPDLRQRSEAFQ